jgi:hypothetical protein
LYNRDPGGRRLLKLGVARPMASGPADPAGS